MPVESAVAHVVEELCAVPALTPDVLLRLRRVARYDLAERQALLRLAASLEGSALSAEEKNLRACTYAWVLEQPERAEAEAKHLSGPLANFLGGELALEAGRGEEAMSRLKSAQAGFPDMPALGIELAAAAIAAGKLEEAEALLAQLEKQGVTDAELYYQRGRACEKRGAHEEACGCYQQALEHDPEHSGAAFRLAYYLDLRGENDRAIELYRRVTGQGQAFISAMINLGLLLEDRDDLDGAIGCFKQALRADPTNRRAALHLRDAVESLDMYYDEAQRKENERLESVLRTPISDFELSVRSRNCLAKMNVKTLGDLVRRGEHELLAFKNFGDTSLNEIKNLLQSKGLRLGMFKEEDARRARAARLRAGMPENPALLKAVAELEFSVRARRCMQRLNIEAVGDLVEKTEAELLATKNFGQTSLNEVKARLGELGLSLRPPEP